MAIEGNKPTVAGPSLLKCEPEEGKSFRLDLISFNQRWPRFTEQTKLPTRSISHVNRRTRNKRRCMQNQSHCTLLYATLILARDNCLVGAYVDLQGVTGTSNKCDNMGFLFYFAREMQFLFSYFTPEFFSCLIFSRFN